MAIDIEEFIKELDPDEPCGEDLEYDAKFIELEQDIKGKPEQQVGNTVIEAEPPNWRNIRKQAEALATRTRDLRVSIYLLRALIALEGFSGLQDGLQLIKALVEQRWNSFHPQLDPDDDNDPTIRINILLSLCDHDTILWPLQQIPFIHSKALGQFNFRDISIALGNSTPTGKEKPVNKATIDGAIQDCDLEQLQSVLKNINVSIDALNDIENTVTEQVGISQAPSFAELSKLLKECKTFLAAKVSEKGGVEEVTDQADEELSIEENGITTQQQAPKAPSGVISNDQDVLKVLNQVCEYYRKNEPSSPVPFFIERAMRVVGKTFLEVLQDIAPAGVNEAKALFGKQDNENN